MSFKIRKISVTQARAMAWGNMRETVDGTVERWKADGFVEQSAIEKYEEARKKHGEGIYVSDVFDLADAAIKELREASSGR